MNATIAEFLLRHASDAKELAQRAQLLAALTQLSPQRRNELAQAVDMVCRTIAAHGGKGKVRFSLVQRGGHRCIEVCGCDRSGECARRARRTCCDRLARLRPAQDDRGGGGDPARRRTGRPLRIVRLAGGGSRHSHGPDVVAGVCVPHRGRSGRVGHAAQGQHGLRRACRPPCAAHGRSKRRSTVPAALEELRAGLAARGTDAENLTMLSLVISKTKNAIAIMEPDGTITAVNAAFVQMTGYLPAEAVGQRYDELLSRTEHGRRCAGRVPASSRERASNWCRTCCSTARTAPRSGSKAT